MDQNQLHLSTQEKAYLSTQDQIHFSTQDQIQFSTQEQIHFSTQEQIHFSTQEQIHLSTQEQSVSFVSRRSPLLLLPDKALLHLLRLLDALTLARLALTSKRLYHLCWSPTLWTSVVLHGPVDADLALSCLLATLARERGRGVVSAFVLYLVCNICCSFAIFIYAILHCQEI